MFPSPVCFYVPLSARQFWRCLFFHLLVCSGVCPSRYLFVCSGICPSRYLFVCSGVCPSVPLSDRLSAVSFCSASSRFFFAFASPRPCFVRMLGSNCVSSRTMTEAAMAPAAGGTKAVEPGRSRRSVHFLVVPGGQMQ